MLGGFTFTCTYNSSTISVQNPVNVISYHTPDIVETPMIKQIVALGIALLPWIYDFTIEQWRNFKINIWIFRKKKIISPIYTWLDIFVGYSVGYSDILVTDRQTNKGI